MVPRDFRLALNAVLRKVQLSIFFFLLVKAAVISLNLRKCKTQKKQSPNIISLTRRRQLQ